MYSSRPKPTTSPVSAPRISPINLPFGDSNDVFVIRSLITRARNPVHLPDDLLNLKPFEQESDREKPRQKKKSRKSSFSHRRTFIDDAAIQFASMSLARELQDPYHAPPFLPQLRSFPIEPWDILQSIP